MVAETKLAYKEANEMLAKTRTTIIILFAALAALALPASALAEYPNQWKYKNRDHRSSPAVAQPLPGTLYDLLNEAKGSLGPRSSLNYGFTGCGGAAVGAELQWGSPGYLQWEFQRLSSHPPTQAITGTERIALYNHFIGKYLIREDETFGINLGLSATPSYEWQIADGQGYYSAAELYNTNEHAYLLWANVGAPTCGIDLRWLHAPFSLPNGYQPPPEGGQFRKGLPEAPPESPKAAPESGSPEPPKNAPESGSPHPTREAPTSSSPPPAAQ